MCNKKHLLHIFPSFNDIDRKKMSAINKYGYGFKEDMELLVEGKTTLAAVGERHGLTRQRVWQIFPVFSGGQKYGNIVDVKKTIAAKNNEEKKRVRKTVASRLDRYKRGSSVYTGLIAENIFANKCKALGYGVEVTGGVVDFTVNGLRVDVKSCVQSRKSARSINQRFYTFPSREKQYQEADFYAVLLFDIDTWYIIPKSELTAPKEGKGACFNIPKYDVEYNGYHRYGDLLKYREAWHLLSADGLHR